jgi:hypothetical protein
MSRHRLTHLATEDKWVDHNLNVPWFSALMAIQNRPYKCVYDGCGMTFVQAINLQVHINYIQ